MRATGGSLMHKTETEPYGLGFPVGTGTGQWKEVVGGCAVREMQE